MGYPGAKYQAGLEPIDVVEVTAARAIARLMGAAFAEVRPTSATLANLAVYTALTEPGDTIAVLPDWAGGHLSHHAVGVPGVRGLRVAPLPYDAEQLDVDLDALDDVPRLGGAAAGRRRREPDAVPAPADARSPRSCARTGSRCSTTRRTWPG